MLFLLIYRSLLFLLPMIQNSLQPRCLFFLDVRLSLVFQVLVLRLLVGVVESVSLFVLPDSVRVSIVYLFLYLLLFGCFRISPGIF